MTEQLARESQRRPGSTWRIVLAAVLAILVVIVMPTSAMAGTPKYSLSISKSEGGTQPLSNPRAVATDSAGNVYVIAGSPGQSIQKFSSTGKYLAKFATGQIGEASGISIDSKGNMWVADTGNWRVVEFNSTGTLVKTLSWSWERPRSVDVDSTGNVWYLTLNWLLKYNSAGEIIDFYELPSNLPYEGGVAIDLDSAGIPWVTDNRSPGYVMHLGGGGGGAEGLVGAAAGVASDPSGNVWLAFGGSCRVSKLSPAGVTLDGFGKCGSGAGEFGSISKAAGLARGPEGALWVADSGKNAVQKWVPTP